MLVLEHTLTRHEGVVVEDPAAAVGEAVPIDGEAVALSVDFGAVDSRANGGDLPGFEYVACVIAGIDWSAPDSDLEMGSLRT
jgi:hypothetical protein